MSLTGNFDVDLKILSSLDDRSLLRFCQIEKKVAIFFRNESFWRNRYFEKFGSNQTSSKSPKLAATWKKNYLKRIFMLPAYHYLRTNGTAYRGTEEVKYVLDAKLNLVFPEDTEKKPVKVGDVIYLNNEERDISSVWFVSEIQRKSSKEQIRERLFKVKTTHFDTILLGRIHITVDDTKVILNFYNYIDHNYLGNEEEIIDDYIPIFKILLKNFNDKKQYVKTVKHTYKLEAKKIMMESEEYLKDSKNLIFI